MARLTRPWEVRRGFLVGALIGFAVAGTSLKAITFLPAVSRILTAPEPLTALPHPAPRLGVPSELAWFFVKFPYLSAQTQIIPHNHHTFRITDEQRQKNYVVTFGQRFRRVEIYSKDHPEEVTVRLYTPGIIRSVRMVKGFVMEDRQTPEGNYWMWARPLWNSLHLKIYGLTDLWINAPYRKYSCAGFVHQFLSDAGVQVPVLDAWDMARLPWARIAVDEMEPGDIVTIRAASREHRRFWGHRITHVGVYIGNNKIIHASTASPKARRSFIKISDLSDFNTRVDRILRPPELE